MGMKPFEIVPDSTATISASTTTSRAAVVNKSTTKTNVRIYNAGSATAFIKPGTSTVEATTDNDCPIPSGAVETFALRDDHTHIAAITASGTATVYVTTGEGI